MPAKHDKEDPRDRERLQRLLRRLSHDAGDGRNTRLIIQHLQTLYPRELSTATDQNSSLAPVGNVLMEPVSSVGATSSRTDIHVPVGVVRSGLLRKSHRCSDCGRSFTRATTLRRHIQTIHIGRERLNCELCPTLDFARQDILDRHKATVHDGFGKTTCQGCGRAVRNDDFERHLDAKGGACRVALSLSVSHQLTSPSSEQPSEHQTQRSGISPIAASASLNAFSCGPSVAASSGLALRGTNCSMVPEPSLLSLQTDNSRLFGISPECVSTTHLSHICIAEMELSRNERPSPLTGWIESLNVGNSPQVNIAASHHGPMLCEQEEHNSDANSDEILQAVDWLPKSNDITKSKRQLLAASRNSENLSSPQNRMIRPVIGGICDVCDDRLGDTIDEVYRHARNHLLNPPCAYRACERCRMQFVYERDLRQHRVNTSECQERRQANALGVDWITAAISEKSLSETRTWEKLQLSLFLQEVLCLVRSTSDTASLSLHSDPGPLDNYTRQMARNSFVSLDSCLTEIEQHHNVDMEVLRQNFARASLHEPIIPKQWPGSFTLSDCEPDIPKAVGEWLAPADQQPQVSDSYRILVLGGFCGKSSLIAQFVYNKCTFDYDPTIIDVHSKAVEVDEQWTNLAIVDCRSDESHLDLLDNNLRDADGVVLCYSIASRWSFHEMKCLQELVQLRKHNVPCVIVGTQSDKAYDREVAKDEIQTVCSATLQPFSCETSVLNEINIDLPFTQLVRQIRVSQRPDACLASSMQDAGPQRQPLAESNLLSKASIHVTRSINPFRRRSKRPYVLKFKDLPTLSEFANSDSNFWADISAFDQKNNLATSSSTIWSRFQSALLRRHRTSVRASGLQCDLMHRRPILVY